MKYTSKAIDWTKLKTIFDMLQQFGPIMFSFLTTVFDVFKKQEMKGIPEGDYGDCCPDAAALADEIVLEVAKLQAVAVKIKADPCSEGPCKEYMDCLSVLVAKGLKLHACHRE